MTQQALTLTEQERDAIANGASSLESEAMRLANLFAAHEMRRFAVILRQLLNRLEDANVQGQV